MKSRSLGLSRPWRPTHRPVCDLAESFVAFESSLTIQTGLQTPRLKRLAEIVSAQAMAQQEKFEIENGVLEE